MNGDDFFGIVVMLTVLFLAGAGIERFAVDYRHFGDIVKQCEKQGYIQNTTTRIQCKVEK